MNLPECYQSEKIIIGACLHSKENLFDSTYHLTAQDFYHTDHYHLFEIIERLAKNGSPVDVHSLHVEAKRLYGNDYRRLVDKAISCACSVVSMIDVDFYINTIKSKRRARELIQSALEVVDKCQKNQDVDQIFSIHQKKLLEIASNTRTGFSSFGAIQKEYKTGKSFDEVFLEQIKMVGDGQDIFQGMRSGYENLDSIIGGFSNGTVNIVGARSSSGKTTFLVNLFLNIWKNYPDKKMGFFSLEMPKHRIFDKLLATYSGVNQKKFDERILTPKEIEKINESSKELSSMNLLIYDSSSTTVWDLCKSTRRETAIDGLDIIFIDYLTRIQSSQKNTTKHLQIDEISKALQDLALDLNIPIVTLCQLNRQVYGRENKTPVLGDLRESGSIEEDADLVLLLHRPAQFDSTKTDNTHLIVAKNRIRGDLGKTEYKYQNGYLVELLPVGEILSNEPFSPEKPLKKR